MKILVTGARGFVGKNLCATLKNLPRENAPELLEYDLDTPEEALEVWCGECDFVFHLAGVNRPRKEEEFMQGNFGLTARLLSALERHQNTCPVMLSSSIQAALDNPYGKSKLAGEMLLREYAQRTGAKILIYRFPNLFGKWCRPNYNSVVATFCHNIARDLPITVNDPSTKLRLAYIDDVVEELLRALKGQAHEKGGLCYVPVEHEVLLGDVARLLSGFRASRQDRSVPDVSDPFTRKLYATYLSYLPQDAFSYPLEKHADARGSFTEILRTADRGQFSVNISKPGIVKGNHWHHSKNEKFLVVSGEGVIRFRRVGTNEVIQYRVSGENPVVVDIPTGYTHNIENLGEGDLVTFMWASECFDPEHPDTYPMEV